ncbi:MAG: alpha/beta hydrolase [Ktedonobacterales bacterium]
MEKQLRDGGPHARQPILAAGEPLPTARAVMLMLHGRGASAEDILSLASELGQPGFAYLAPQAAGFAWYPNSFLAPLPSNEPFLSSALLLIENVLTQVESAGIPAERTVLLGFSQGACLGVEYVVRHARRYGAVVGLSGGLIGPEGTVWNYPGSLAGTPVFLGCSDSDMHVPKSRVDLTQAVLDRMDGHVTERIYPHLGHTVNQDEIDFVRELLLSLTK